VDMLVACKNTMSMSLCTGISAMRLVGMQD
jgi:hypothetical protein